jgi:hypothetical protein
LEIFKGDTSGDVIDVSKEMGDATVSVIAYMVSKEACIGSFFEEGVEGL